MTGGPKRDAEDEANPRTDATALSARRDRPGTILHLVSSVAGLRSLLDARRLGAAGALVLLLVASIVAVTALVMKTGQYATAARREAASYTPPAISPAAVQRPVVSVIGDGTVTQSDASVPAGGRWPSLLGSALGTDVTALASAGMGYVTTDGSGRTFGREARSIPKDTTVVIFIGGAVDAEVPPLSILKAATRAFATAKERAPKAEIIVIGPAISAGLSTDSVARVGALLKSSATVANATWVDPFADRWLPSASRAASSATGLSLADEETLAIRIQGEIEKTVR